MKSFVWTLVISLSALALQASAAEQTQTVPQGQQSQQTQPTQQVQTSALPAPAKEHSFGFRLDPVWVLIGGIGGEVDFRMSRTISLGIGGYNIFPHSTTHSTSTTTTSSGTTFTWDDDYKWSAYEIYVGPTIMLMGDYDHRGLYLAPGVGYTGAKITDFGTSKLSGSMDAPELRLTVGYQWVVKNFRFTTGGGIRAIGSSDVVVKDDTGNEVLREKSSTLGGLALDLGVGMVF